MNSTFSRRTYLVTTAATLGFGGCSRLAPGSGADGIKNGGFEDGTEKGQENLDLPGWEVEHGDTHYIGLTDDGIDGQSVRTKWKANSVDAAPASVSQTVDLGDANAVLIDVAGRGGNPFRSEIILEVDGQREGTFVRGPERYTEYRDQKVELSDSYDGEHTITIKWSQITGDNIGNSLIDNVRLSSE